MGTVVLDTSVLLNALDPDDALHEAARTAILEHRKSGHSFVAPTSVLAEALVGASRQGAEVSQRMERAVDILISWIAPIDREIARTAAAVRAEHAAIRLPDALVIATGRVTDAAAVLTGDKRWSGVDSRIRLITGP